MRFIDPDRGPREVFRDEDTEGRVGVRRPGCWRILRNPDAPSPCSCSVIIGDLPHRLISQSDSLCCMASFPYAIAIRKPAEPSITLVQNASGAA